METVIHPGVICSSVSAWANTTKRERESTSSAWPMRKVLLAHTMCQDEDDMKKLVTNHDLDLFPLRVARAINQQVIAPAFAFLYSMVDMSRGFFWEEKKNSWNHGMPKILDSASNSIYTNFFSHFHISTPPSLPIPRLVYHSPSATTNSLVLLKIDIVITVRLNCLRSRATWCASPRQIACRRSSW